MNRGSAEAMLTAVSVCIDAEMKDMPNAASGNGIDPGASVSWYGEVSWATKIDLVVVQGKSQCSTLC